MSLVVDDLANEINSALAAKDSSGSAISVTKEMKTYAKAIIETHTKEAKAFFAPGSVTGTAPSAPGPVPDLSAMNGTYQPPFNTLSSKWKSTMKSGFPTAKDSELQKEADASTQYIQEATKINFSIGNLSGQSTAAPGPTPGTLESGEGKKGKVTGLVGSAWAPKVTPPTGDPKLAEKLYNAIVKYLKQNAEVKFNPGDIKGTFAAPDTPLVAGTASNGKVL